MSRRQVALLFMVLGVVVLLSQWGRLVDRLAGANRAGDRKVTIWSNSGSPHVELRSARDFEKRFPGARVDLQFRVSSRLADTIYVSFLSGNPPDTMSVALSDLRDLVAAGMLRPMDDLLAQTLKEHPAFVEQRIDGQSSLFYFRANPNDPFIRQKDKYPLEAARLLHMHGRLVGFVASGGSATVTYNKRLFRSAAAMFPEAGLVDPQGEPLPPRTWMDLLRKAKVLTDYGRRSGEGCYGLVVQGKAPRDIMRGLEPLAATAGTRGFNFAGKPWVAGVDAPVGFFEYEHPGLLAAFGLFLALKADGSILPGTSSRDFEDSRSAVGIGQAAMIIDGWHSALIACERVPLAKNDIGSGPIPVPYEVDDQGRPNLEQKRELEAFLGLTVPRGRAFRGDPNNVACITSGARHPRLTWDWMHYGTLEPAQERTNTRRGGLPGSKNGAARIDDPDWFPLPFQKQAWAVTNASALWPQPPYTRPVPLADYQNVLQHAFLEKEMAPGDRQQLAQIVAGLRERLAKYSAAQNQLLQERVLSREDLPSVWTFPDFDPLHPVQFFDRQRQSAKDPAISAAVRQEVESLPPEFRTVDDPYSFFKFETSASRWAILWAPVLLGLTALGFILWQGLGNALAPKLSSGRVPLLAMARQARRNWHGYVFVVPGMLTLFAFVIYPTFYMIYLSVHEGSGITPLQYVGAKHFARIFDWTQPGNWDATFWTKVLPNTFLYMIVVTACQISLGLLVANLLNLPLRMSRLVSVLFFIPMSVSLAAVSVVFLGLLGGPTSAVNGIITELGLERLPMWLGLSHPHDWLGSAETDLYSVMLVGIWSGLPYNTILLLAGLQSIDPQLYEAGKVDGAGPAQRFWHITIPELGPILVVIAFNALVGAARVFGPVFILTEGGKDHSSEVAATYIYKWAFTKPPNQQPDIGYASALGLVYSAILALLTLTNVIIIARRWRRRLATERRAGAPAGTREPAATTTGVAHG